MGSNVPVPVALNSLAPSASLSTFQGQLSVLDWENGRPYWSKDLSSHQTISSYLGTLFVADDEGLVALRELEKQGAEIRGSSPFIRLLMTGNMST